MAHKQQEQEQEQQQEQEPEMVDVEMPYRPQMSLEEIMALLNVTPKQRRQQGQRRELTVTSRRPMGIPQQSCVNPRCGIEGRECLDVYSTECGGPWIRGDAIANQGSYGLVRYATMRDGDKFYIIKELNDTEDRVLNEVYKHITAAQNDLAPPVLEFMIHSRSEAAMTASIVMPMLKITMREYLDKYKSLTIFKKTIKAALALLSSLSDIGILHMDARLDNYMMGEKGKWFLIDYGSAISGDDLNDISVNMDSFFESASRFVRNSTSDKDKAAKAKFLAQMKKDTFGE
jgi:tRNA A-37 threonylcarbamoyl transferase component Bud32